MKQVSKIIYNQETKSFSFSVLGSIALSGLASAGMSLLRSGIARRRYRKSLEAQGMNSYEAKLKAREDFRKARRRGAIKSALIGGALGGIGAGIGNLASNGVGSGLANTISNSKLGALGSKAASSIAGKLGSLKFR